MSDAPSTSAAYRLRSFESNEDRDFNDDEAERSSLVAVEGIETGRRLSESSTVQTEHFQNCLKLFAENKITKENSWKLRLIDFMAAMLWRHDPRMENLQTASMALDASARIYAFRVDAVHDAVLKMAGNLLNTSQGNRRRRRSEMQDGAADAEPPRRRRRKRPAIAANPAVLDAPLETVDCIDPLFQRLAVIPGDITAINKAFNANLDVDDETQAFKLRTDVPFFDPVSESLLETLDLGERITIATDLMPRFTAGDVICRPFAGFNIAATEDSVEPWSDSSEDLAHQSLVFDVEAQVQPIPQEEPHNISEVQPDGMAMDVDDDTFEEIRVTRLSVAQPPRLSVAQPPRLSEIPPQDSNDRQLQNAYCSIIEGAWAGPAHWRIKNNLAARPLTATQTVGQSSAREILRRRRRKRPIDFLGAGMAFDARAEPTGVYAPVPPSQIMVTRYILDRGRSWNVQKYKRPIDLGLNASHFGTLYLRRNALKKRQDPHVDEPVPAAELAEPMEIDIEDDITPFCADSLPKTTAAATTGTTVDMLHDPATTEEAVPGFSNHYNTAPGPSAELEPAVTEEPEESDEDLLEPPAKIARTEIPYAKRPKKIDMKELKKSTWNLLTKDVPQGQGEEVPVTKFSSVFSQLPRVLRPPMLESLSMPLAFLSVLHLANEHGLDLEQQEDLKDFRIRKNDILPKD